MGSWPQAQEELEEITWRLLGYNCRVAEIVQETPGVEQPGICTRIMLSLAVEQLFGGGPPTQHPRQFVGKAWHASPRRG